MLVESYTYDLIKHKAAYPIYLRWKINKMELWLLGAIHARLQAENRTIMSKERIFESITGNCRMFPRFQGYYTGLVNKGAVGTYEYVRSPGSECVGLSDLGVRILKEYDIEVARLHEQNKPHPHRLEFTSAVEEPNELYISRQTA